MSFLGGVSRCPGFTNFAPKNWRMTSNGNDNGVVGFILIGCCTHGSKTGWLKMRYTPINLSYWKRKPNW